jgi:hypothetical protein
MVELRDYSGDFEDFDELTRRVWIPEYGGTIWIAIPDTDFMRWRFGPQSGALCSVAYAGTKLVGSVVSVPQSLRIGSTVHQAASYTGFSVEPEYGRFALPLIERLRQEDEQRGVSFGIGMVLDNPRSASYRFWTRYERTFPQNFRLLFRGGYWVKVLAPRQMSRAGIEAWERVAGRALGPLLSATYGYDPHVRRYQIADLERCAQILDKASARFDWARVWAPEQLSSQLQSPVTKTLVFERDGGVKAMVNYHCMSMHGRVTLRAALINLWAEDGLTGIERIRLLSHLCNDLRGNGVHLVVAVRGAMMPAAAFVANLFLPTPPQFRIGVLFTRRTIRLSPPKTWSFEII